MEAVNKRTGAKIKGTLERLQGRAEITDIQMGVDGKLTYNHQGGTVIFWDAGKTAVDNGGSPIFLDDDGEEVPESSVALVEPEDALALREQTQTGRDLHSIRQVLAILRRSTSPGDATTLTIQLLESHEEAICQQRAEDTKPAAQPG